MEDFNDWFTMKVCSSPHLVPCCVNAQEIISHSRSNVKLSLLKIWLLQEIVVDEKKVEEVLVFDSCDESENVAVKEGEESIEPPVSQSGDIPCSDQTPNLVEVETEEVEARAIRKQEIMCQGKTLSSSEESTESEDPG
ncbi:hypothetical protein Dimus_018329 [Dionaea muscipula]